MNYIQPKAFNLNQERYHPNKSFPTYRHVPGVTPHPISNPQGHSYNVKITDDVILDPNNWKENSTYLYAIDLFNYAYWWESHEFLEELWNNLEQDSTEKILLQAIIQSAAALIKWFQNNNKGMVKLFSKSKSKIDLILDKNKKVNIFGVDIPSLNEQIDCFLSNNLQTQGCEFQIVLYFK